MFAYKNHIGLINLGQTCYVNSLLQLLFSCKDFNNFVIGFKNKEQDTVFSAYKTLILAMYKNTDINIIKPTKFIKTLIETHTHLARRQQDANELLCLLINNFIESTKIEFTKYHFLSLISNFKYNTRIKNECARYILKHYNNEYSYINNLFDIHVINDIYCEKCKQLVSSRIEMLQNIDLPIEHDAIDNLNTAFDSYLSREKLDNDYKCPLCNENNCCEKEIKILNIQKYLFITLKRFKYDKGAYLKNNKYIDFPNTINMDKYLLKDNENTEHKKNNNYILQGYVNHTGNLNSGHYFSILKNDEKWNMLDDDSVIKLNKLNKNAAYILLFKLQE